MNHTLCLDTSTSYLSLAIYQGNELRCAIHEDVGHKMSEMLTKKIKECLTTCGLSLKDIDAYTVGLGPGSFTSLRVGISTLKGLVLAYPSPVYPVNSLRLLAEQTPLDQDDLCILSDARRDMIYAALYQRKDGVLIDMQAPVLIKPHQLMKLIPKQAYLFGDGIKVCREVLGEDFAQLEIQKKWCCSEEKVQPNAKDLFSILMNNKEHLKPVDIVSLAPIYLYPEDCQVHR